ncbi:hypothetical protein UFOVP315_47 [uncultured Caudovirales phage]|uniref:Uncharacterized protein n=1 Tax=uncultured Caudovirales phage TaxID=2100421 RepID=A0A6J5LR15_9CAUD|nr:hypothetical protein UFOVP315_47 [uncultured Caudovirales phage]
MTRRPITPTERREQREDFAKAIRDEQAALEHAINEVASTEAGTRVLRHIASSTGHGKNPVVFRSEQGMVLPMEGATLYNGARYSVYAELREYLTPNNRMKVEKTL